MSNIKTSNTVTSTTLPIVVNDLIAKRQHWENGAYAISNLELYGVIGGCVDLFNAVKGQPALAKGLNEVLRKLGVTFNDHTSLELRVARLVFASHGAETKTENRVSAYALVIRLAAEHKQTSVTIAKFITDNHGIEEIRRSGVNSAKLTAGKLAERNREVADHKLADLATASILDNFVLPDALKPEAGRRFSLALVRENPDGTGSIVFGTANVSAVNSVLAIAGKGIAADMHLQAEIALSKQQADQREANMQAFNEVASNIASSTLVAA